MGPNNQVQTRHDSAATEGSDQYVQRFDRGGELLPPREQPDGTWLVEGFAAKPGILHYMDDDGNVTRELIEEGELHKPESLATLARAAVTLEHPDEDVSPDNVDELGVGDVDGSIEVIEAGGFVKVRLAVRRRDAQRSIRAGKRELSPGYKLIIDPTPGIHPEFGPYDVVQRDRVYNHLAIVDAARGGPSIKLRADAAYQLPETGEQQMNPRLLALLALVGLDPSRFDSDDKALEALTAKAKADAENADKAAKEDAASGAKQLQAQLDAMTKENADLKAQLDELNGKFTALKAVADALKKDRVDADNAAERERLAKLAERVDGIEPEKFLPKGANEEQLKSARAALAKAHFDCLGCEFPTDATDEFVQGVLATIPDKAVERDPWAGLSRDDSEPKPKPPDGEREDGDKTPSVIYFDNAKAAFEAARGGTK